jgi:hypothetical protein
MLGGNKGRYNLLGEDLSLLVPYKLIWHHSVNFDCIAFIANNFIDREIYNEKDVSRALLDLGYTQKVTSKKDYQAFT